MKKIKFFFITIANKDYGIGHLSRISKIIKYLNKNYKFEIELFILGKNYFLNQSKNLKIKQFKNKTLYLNNLKTKLSNTHQSIVVFDLPINEAKNKFLEVINNDNNTYIAIDCFLKFNKKFKFLWIPSFYLPKEIKNKKKIYYGRNKYLIGESKPKKIINKKTIKNVAIFSGGSDVFDFNKTILQNLNLEVKQKLNLFFIIGPFSKKFSKPKNSLHSYNIIYDLKEIKTLCKKIDLAITPHGVTLFELMYFGIPTLSFIPNKKIRNEEIKKLKNLNVTTIANSFGDLFKKLDLILSNKINTNLITNNAFKFVKTDGVNEFVKKIFKIIIR